LEDNELKRIILFSSIRIRERGFY